MFARRPLTRSTWLILMSVLGVIGLAVNLTIPAFSQIRSIASFILDIAALILTLLIGRWARKHQLKPTRLGGLALMLYGLVSSLSVLGLHVRVSQLHSRAPQLSNKILQHEAAVINSPFLHLTTVVLSALGYGALGWIIGWLGGFLNPKPSDSGV